ncbi:MAG: SUMF1/EgtB/PvdO family nonheme iron enzyme [Chloroflexi bacterium]|nr:SUMF1/EgtB/PvdO family nonheme iron enzyme [Chloroflexota bacterium]MCA2000410.1 SUMF1/EgtB/PvdO family nonheme iron enzyme [Chloroflexota bacterium]
MPRPLRVFLCHASQDKPAVRELYQRLLKEGWIAPWFDETSIPLGQHWTTTIEKAIDDADIVLIFLSNHSVRKEGFVQRELHYAWDISLEKPHGVIFLIPLRLDDCEIPRFLSSHQWGDYFGDKKERTFQSLLNSLRIRYEQKANSESQSGANQESSYLLARREAEEKAAREKIRREHLQWEVAREAARKKESREAARQPKQNLLAPLRGVGILSLLALFFIAAWLFVNWLSPAAEPAATEAPTATEPLVVSPAVSPQTLTETPAFGVGSTMTSDKDGMTLVYVPAGEFMMGSLQGDPDEKPSQKIYLDSFWIDQTEVTNAMYALCVAEGACALPRYLGSPNEIKYYGNPKYADYPVIYVNQEMAKAYCEWAGRALPTEAQWEKAARGTEGNIYPWGDKFDGSLLNFCDVNCPEPRAYGYYDDKTVYLARVGYYPGGASVYGALDMAGNVWEWVADFYDAYPNSRASAFDFGKRYPVLRGGSWKHTMYDVRASNRWYFSVASDAFNSYTGFRCALSAE